MLNAKECSDEVSLADDEKLVLTKVGDVRLFVIADGKESTVLLTNVYFASSLALNIVSYGKLDASGYALSYSKGKRVVARRIDALAVFDVVIRNSVLVVRTVGMLARTKEPVDVIMAALQEELAADTSSVMHRGSLLHFHQRLEHLSFYTIAKNPSSGIELTDHKRMTCITCAQSKQTKNKQSQKDSGRNAPIDRIGGVICSDLKGTLTPADRLQNRYLINFIDYKSNYCRVFLARTKDAAAKKFERFLAFFERQFECRIAVLRTDGCGEYQNVDLFCKTTGVARKVSEAKNQASNGKAERMHRTILNMTRAMIFASGLPLTFWGDAAEYSTYILNRIPTNSYPKRASPLEVLTGQAPDLRNIVVFGSHCTVYRDPSKNNFAHRAQVGSILGCSNETKGFRVYLKKDNKVITTQHVQNIETLTEAQNRQLKLELDDDDRADADEGAQEQPKRQQTSKSKQKSQWTRQPHATRGATKKAASSQVESPSTGDIVAHVFERDPRNYAEAMKSVKSQEWQAAMSEEIAALEANDVWTLSRRSSRSNVLHSKWAYKTKTTADGELERHKARLVACGNEQVFDVDYALTFAAVMDMTTVKMILALAATWGIPAKHGDVPNAYVKAEKEQHLEILMHVLKGMTIGKDKLKELRVDSDAEVVLELKKSLYGLKQVGRLWSQLLLKRLEEADFTRCISDLCLYYRRDAAGVVIVGVYVDDLLVNGTTSEAVEAFFASLKCLSIKNLGPVTKFLGMRVTHSNEREYLLDQEEAILDMLQQHGMLEANAARAPIGADCYDTVSVESKLLPVTSAPGQPNVRTFQSLVGSLLWVARCTRPDIAFAVHKVTRQTHAPRTQDWKLAKRIVRYLSGTRALKIRMTATAQADAQPTLVSYSDADYAADKSDRKSLSGCVVLLNDMAVSWWSKKQGGVSLSTMESEFVAASEAGRELLGIRETLTEIGVTPTLPLTMHIDNQAAIVQIAGEATSTKAKHIDVCVKYLCDQARRGIVAPIYVKSELMLADVLTKALDASKLVELRTLLQIA